MAYKVINSKTNVCVGSYPWIRTALKAAQKQFTGQSDQWDIVNELGEVVAWSSFLGQVDMGAACVPEHRFLPLRLLQRSCRRRFSRGTPEASR